MKENILLAALFVIVANILFYSSVLGVITGFVFLSLAVFYYLTKTKQDKNLGLAFSAAALSVVFGFLCGGRANEVVFLVNLIAATYFSAIACFYFKSAHPFSFGTQSFLFIPLSLLKNVFTSLAPKEATLNTESKESDEVDVTPTPFVKGLLIAAPLFLILAFLLTQADPIFGTLGQQLFSQLGSRAIFSIAVFVLALVLAVTKVKDSIKQTAQEITKEARESKSYTFRVVLVSIITLFTAFILVQLKYLFLSPSEGDLKSLGIDTLTYSDYVRRGFFELVIASVISSFIIVYVLRFLHHLQGADKRLMQILNGVLTVETLLLLVSALERLSLYEAAHGLTRARIFGVVFLAWLAALLIIFFIRVVRNIQEEYSFIAVTSISLIALLVVNAVNIDGLIATDFRPTVNGEVDYYYLAALSPDAAGSWPDIVNDMTSQLIQLSKKPDLSSDDGRKLYLIQSTLSQLKTRIDYLSNKYGSPDEFSDGSGGQDERNWQSFNLSEYRAYISIIQQKEIFNKIPSLLNEESALEGRLSDEDRQNLQIDRDMNPPLVSHPSNEAL